MRFLIDAQLPPRLAARLVSLGHEAHHVAEFEMLRAKDRAIWAKAIELDATIMSKDADFVTLRALRAGGPAIVWIRLGNVSRAALLARIERALPNIVDQIERGEDVVVVT
jgi:predicted nuclease of predicted toxin-antitoxin system